MLNFNARACAEKRLMELNEIDEFRAAGFSIQFYTKTILKKT